MTDDGVNRFDDDGGPTPSERDGQQPGAVAWGPTTGERGLDGAWWPRSRDAVVELASLIPLVSEHLGGPVRRVSLNIDAWDADQPRRLGVNGELVRLGWFHTLDPAIVTLGRRNDDRVTLLVIPPSMEPATARRLMQRLSTATDWPDNAESALNGQWPADDVQTTARGPSWGTVPEITRQREEEESP